MSEHKQILQSLAKKVSTEPNSGGGCEDNIQTEAVNYVGYYSTHEQSMEAVMHLQASRTGTVHWWQLLLQQGSLYEVKVPTLDG